MSLSIAKINRLTNPNTNLNVTMLRQISGRHNVSLTNRVRRFNYEDTHEWPGDDSLEYDFDENGQEGQELTLWEEIGMNWQKVGVRLIFLLAIACFLFMLTLCWGKILCRICCQSMKKTCCPCGGFLDAITSCYEDPMYKRARELADLFGLKLDYATYVKIKDRAEQEAEGPFNPLGLPQTA